MTIVGAVALCIPLLVTAVICVIARREGSALPATALIRLCIGTGAALVVWRFVPHPVAIIALSLAVFGLLVIPVTRAIERSVRKGIVDSVRSADLAPRSVGMYLPLAARTGLMMTGLGLLVCVTARAISARPTLMTIGFTFAAITFFGLYESWIRQEVFSVRARDDADRRSRVRAIFVAQCILTLSFLLLAILTVSSWPGLITLGAIAGVLGGIGCGLALSTGIQRRYLEVSASR